MRAILLSFVLWLGFSAQLAAAEDVPFAVGQVWSLAGEAYPKARVVIDKLETWHEGRAIVHITVLNVPVINAAGQPIETTFSHLPYDQEALRRSVAVVVQTQDGPFAGYEDGYQVWKDDNGGVFTITVSEAVAAIAPYVHPK